MEHHLAARRRFAALIRRPDPQVPLAEAALALAWEDQGGPAPWAHLARLDAMARAAAPRVAAARPGERGGALAAYLHGELGFRGDPGCYSAPDPADSYLDRVLERRAGLPILLAVVYLEVGWRLGLPLQGVALPGHFIVRLADPEGDQLLDPFAGGAAWSLEDCERQVASYYGETGPELLAMVMAPPGRGAILARILRNLKQTHLARDDNARALAAVERLLMLDASDPGELRDRGLLRLRAGRLHAALEDLERYARQNPAAGDLATIKSIAAGVVEKVAPRN
ncbi:MAG TPA: transglutaminase-like domain-containing protein [Chloroflexaceae bacterium]|nr:transglutaminase-like domain-containing protein [Chloroflexaceae bacterium]